MKRLLFFLTMLGSFCSIAQRLETPGGTTQDADQLINSYQFEQALRLLSAADDSLAIGVIQRKGR